MWTVLFHYVVALYFSAFVPENHRFPNSVRIKYFRLTLKPFFHWFVSWPMLISEKQYRQCWFFGCLGYADGSTA